MAEITVEQLAKIVGVAPNWLLNRMKEAGLKVTDSKQVVSDAQKEVLLQSLKTAKKDESVIEKPKTRRLVLSVKKKVVDDESDTVKVVTKRKSKHFVPDVQEVAFDDQVKDQKSEPVVAEEEVAEKEEKPLLNENVEENKGPELPKAPEDEIKEPVVEKAHPVVNNKKAEKVAKALPPIDDEDDIDEINVNKFKSVKLDQKKEQFHSNKNHSEQKWKANKKGKPQSFDKSSHNFYGKNKAADNIVQSFTKPVAAAIKEVQIPESITVADLAQKLAIKATDLIRKMMTMGLMATINQVIDQDTAILVVEEMGHKATALKENDFADELNGNIDYSKLEQVKRAPIVTIMGHVDHGKTSLLDYIRRTKVASGEAGGITQHIGAYRVATSRGVITFLDTPGHEAFTAMRARGAKVTDIVVLVVAADDGVMPQTVEAIQHAKAANVPIIVAINKIDKPEANPEKIRLELSSNGVVWENWGGDTMFVEVSAKKGIGVDTLLDSILTLAEVLDLKAPVNCPARGFVIESRLDKGKGPIASILVQKGTLHKGDVILIGTNYGRIRSMYGENGKVVDSALPSMPVEVLGLSGVPEAGDEITIVESEKKAREIALFRQGKFREVQLAQHGTVKLEDAFSKQGEKVLNIVLKADVQGSIEAIKEVTSKIGNEEIEVKVIASSVGGINTNDVNLAIASNAIIVGFNVRADSVAKKQAERENIEMRYYNIIYNLVDDIKLAISGMLAPKYDEKVIGEAEVREVFRSSKFGTIAGCKVLDGIVKRGKLVRILRDHIVIFDGEIESLRHLKDDVLEVRNGMECGVGIKNYSDIKVKDTLEVYEKVEVKREIV